MGPLILRPDSSIEMLPKAIATPVTDNASLPSLSHGRPYERGGSGVVPLRRGQFPFDPDDLAHVHQEIHHAVEFAEAQVHGVSSRAWSKAGGGGPPIGPNDRAIMAARKVHLMRVSGVIYHAPHQSSTASRPSFSVRVTASLVSGDGCIAPGMGPSASLPSR